MVAPRRWFSSDIPGDQIAERISRGCATDIDEYEWREIRVVAIYGQGFDAVKSFADRESYPFSVLVDEDRSVIRRYGVYVRINYESWNMARPSTVLVDGEGIVRFIFVGRNQRDWPAHEAVFEALEDAQASHGSEPDAPMTRDGPPAEPEAT